MQVALDQHASGQMRIVPIIVEPCDWQSSPLAAFKALPKDGKPISLWANENVALLDIVAELRRVLAAKSTATNARLGAKERQTPTRRLKVKKEFDTIDRSEFRDVAFERIEPISKPRQERSTTWGMI